MGGRTRCSRVRVFCHRRNRWIRQKLPPGDVQLSLAARGGQVLSPRLCRRLDLALTGTAAASAGAGFRPAALGATPAAALGAQTPADAPRDSRSAADPRRLRPAVILPRFRRSSRRRRSRHSKHLLALPSAIRFPHRHRPRTFAACSDRRTRSRCSLFVSAIWPHIAWSRSPPVPAPHCRGVLGGSAHTTPGVPNPPIRGTPDRPAFLAASRRSASTVVSATSGGRPGDSRDTRTGSAQSARQPSGGHVP